MLVDECTAIAKCADPETTAIFTTGWNEVIRTACQSSALGQRKFLHNEGATGVTRGSVGNRHNCGGLSACGKNFRVQVAIANPCDMGQRPRAVLAGTLSCFALGIGAASLSGYSTYRNAESSIPTVKPSVLGIFSSG